jgi:hypothetical protein
VIGGALLRCGLNIEKSFLNRFNRALLVSLADGGELL